MRKFEHMHKLHLGDLSKLVAMILCATELYVAHDDTMRAAVRGPTRIKRFQASGNCFPR